MDCKNRLIMAAICEFGDYGYENASTERICAIANLSQSALFRRFKTKEKLFFAALAQCHADLNQHVELSIGSDYVPSYHDIAVYYKRHQDFFEKNPCHYRLLTRLFDIKESAIKERLVQMRRAMNEDTQMQLCLYLNRLPIRQDISREMAVELLSITIEHIQYKYFADIRKTGVIHQEIFSAFVEEVMEAIRVLFVGMLTPQGSEESI